MRADDAPGRAAAHGDPGPARDPRLRVLIIAPNLDGADVGESYSALKLLEAMAPILRLTVLAFECRYGPPLAEQLPAAEVVTFREPAWTRQNERFSAMLKPQLLSFNRHVARWVHAARADGRTFDLAHQILPRAPRYPTALRHLGIPYVIGSLGGALPTPETFRSEAGSASWFTQLRSLDNLRFRYDPWLRASYGRAELVLGVAPYMRDVLADAPIRAFEPFLGIGVSDLAPETRRHALARHLKLLHVGRAVRTKGLRDTVRALAHLRDLPNVTLTSVGDGEEIGPCRAEAERLGVGHRVEFLGRLARDKVEDLYRDSDALVFPSFRESMGGVLYEAMRWGLPIITTRRGGPDWIVDAHCGLKVDIATPDQLARDLGEAIRLLALNPKLRARLGRGGREKLRTEALWSIKAEKMCGLYARAVAAVALRAGPPDQVKPLKRRLPDTTRL